ncbi:hypothetical protein F3Y22_tig00117026pilonHSYRG00142 [Hibiscus syriacus]|uniref:Uncharacterized protein n=1 Tax=Hibiscus syriacus TaxID=106335 RepID=A0A6A2WCM1_HIBSY|nr:hypothetical protein F3Y22_tig00117026pilonHSYRG00142 [Hibiscus syriacus]
MSMNDRYFLSFMRRKTRNPKGITLLQRLCIGFVIQVVAITIAYVVEVQRMQVIRVHQIAGPEQMVSMNTFWLLPQHVLLGIVDVFNVVGLLEFFYDQSPQDGQSLGTTFFTSGIRVGSFWISFFMTMVDKLQAEVRIRAGFVTI